MAAVAITAENKRNKISPLGSGISGRRMRGSDSENERRRRGVQEMLKRGRRHGAYFLRDLPVESRSRRSDYNLHWHAESRTSLRCRYALFRGRRTAGIPATGVVRISLNRAERGAQQPERQEEADENWRVPPHAPLPQELSAAMDSRVGCGRSCAYPARVEPRHPRKLAVKRQAPAQPEMPAPQRRAGWSAGSSTGTRGTG